MYVRMLCGEKIQFKVELFVNGTRSALKETRKSVPLLLEGREGKIPLSDISQYTDKPRNEYFV